jgi:dTDP-4-amino-4,6-dideoxygalactose transaminase
MEKLAIHGGIPISPNKIPISRPFFSKKTIKDVSEVIRSGYVRQGPKTQLFENAFKEKVNAKYAYAVNSGTAALHTAYLSILKLGDEVIVPAFTFIATASTVIYSFGKPVFVDVDEDTFCIDVEAVKEKITSKTRAIAPVHLFGNACDMKTLCEIAEDNNLYIVNDAAQAHGTKILDRDIGSFDHLNCYSFYPTKSMTTGEGGIVTTNDETLFKKGGLIRSHGQEGKYYHPILGLNYRMTDISAVIGIDQLSHLDNFIQKRQQIAKLLTNRLKNIDGLLPQKVTRDVTHSYSYYSMVMNLDNFSCTRDEFVKALQNENIDCQIHYPRILTEQPSLKSYIKEKCPVAEKLSTKIFSLPIYPGLKRKEVELIYQGVEKVATYYLKR